GGGSSTLALLGTPLALRRLLRGDTPFPRERHRNQVLAYAVDLVLSAIGGVEVPHILCISERFSGITQAIPAGQSGCLLQDFRRNGISTLLLRSLESIVV